MSLCVSVYVRLGVVKEIDMAASVEHLRDQRMKMVQTEVCTDLLCIDTKILIMTSLDFMISK